MTFWNRDWSGNWAAAADGSAAAAAMAMFVLRPMRARYLAAEEHPAALGAHPIRAV